MILLLYFSAQNYITPIIAFEIILFLFTFVNFNIVLLRIYSYRKYQKYVIVACKGGNYRGGDFSDELEIHVFVGRSLQSVYYVLRVEVDIEVFAYALNLYVFVDVTLFGISLYVDVFLPYLEFDEVSRIFRYDRRSVKTAYKRVSVYRNFGNEFGRDNLRVIYKFAF